MGFNKNASKATKTKTHFVCQECGTPQSKWLGCCPSCQAWGTLHEEQLPPPGPTLAEHSAPITLEDIDMQNISRFGSGSLELDRVLGGGFVPGSLILVGGEPGIGKSTLLLQTAHYIAHAQHKVLYVSAEESLQQIKLRAHRLQLPANPHFYIQCIDELDAILHDAQRFGVGCLVIDSIQTIGSQRIGATIGSIAQIRWVTQQLLHAAKHQNTTVLIIGHVTKEGLIAGPKVMEHMVDTVLYFEGERLGDCRMLRAHKNRFGNAQEIGLFRMESHGLVGMENASQWFLSQRAQAPGALVITSIEGTRALLLEVQALTLSSPYTGNPRRTATGFDVQRLNMLIAILAARAHIDLSAYDIFINIAGGVRIQEPAADLGVLLALVSAFRQRTISPDWIAIGEVGLAGEIRACTQLKQRLAEAAALGFKHALVPKAGWQNIPETDLRVLPIAHISEAFAALGWPESRMPP
jgi:DNA repair protein RadA/Sms